MVEPLRTSGGVGDDDVLALSARLGLRTVTTVSGRALIWGPSEIRLLHPERSDWTATDALTLVKAAGLTPAEVLLVRARLDRASAEGRQEVAGRSGGSAAGASAEWIDRVRVELIQPSTSTIVVESSAEVRVDPFGTGIQGPGPLIDQVLDDAIGGLDAAVGLALPSRRSTSGRCSRRPSGWGSTGRCDGSGSSGSPTPVSARTTRSG